MLKQNNTGHGLRNQFKKLLLLIAMAATIPLALDEALEQGLIGKSGDVVMFTGLGAGITWGGVLYKFP